MKYTLAFLSVLALGACATPQQACLTDATRDLNIVRSLIAQTTATLERGYAVKTTTRYVTISQPCFLKHHPNRWCERTVPSRSRSAVAVDLTAEKRKLRDLQRKEKELSIRSANAAEACRARFPEA